MFKSQSLFISLRQFIGSSKPRLSVLSSLILGVIYAKTVNLTQLAAYQDSRGNEDSQYRKLQRFFQLWVMPWKDIATLILSKIPKPSKGFVLSLDRTNWKHGKIHINILVIGIVVGKVSVPLVWKTLPQSTKRGNSHYKHRIALINRVLQVLGVTDIQALTMDREFCGEDWLNYLSEKDITWVLRIRRNTLVDGKSAFKYKVAQTTKGTDLKSVWGMDLYFAAKFIRQGRTDYLYVVSNKLLPKEALEMYQKRWSIEVLFGHLKKKGFNLEATHLTDKAKIDKLIAVVSIAFLFTLGWGMLIKANTVKLSARQKRKSLFRLALDSIVATIERPSKNRELATLLTKWLFTDLQIPKTVDGMKLIS